MYPDDYAMIYDYEWPKTSDDFAKSNKLMVKGSLLESSSISLVMKILLLLETLEHTK